MGAFERAVEQLSSAPEDAPVTRELALEFLSASAVLLPSSSSTVLEDVTSAVIAQMYTELARRDALRGFGCVSVGASTLAAASAESESAPSSFASARPKLVDVNDLERRSGLPVSALAPKRSTRLWWEFAGAATVLGLNVLARELGYGQYAQPLVLGVFLAWLADQVALRGLVFESVYRFINPRLQEKVITHEAGHFLLAYLCGSPVRGYILSALDAFRAGIPGQAGTIFSDTKLEAEMKQGRLTNGSLERFSVVLMGGIAAEALQYGQAEGGQSDEGVLISLLGANLKPAWSAAAITNQARWAVLEAILILKRQKKAHAALIEAMTERKTLGECIAAIEDNLVPEPERAAPAVAAAAVVAPNMVVDEKRRSGEREERERELQKRLEEIKAELDTLDQHQR